MFAMSGTAFAGRYGAFLLPVMLSILMASEKASAADCQNEFGVLRASNRFQVSEKSFETDLRAYAHRSNLSYDRINLVGKGQKVTLVEHRLENRSGTVWIVISKKPTGGDATASISTSACNQSVQWKVYWQTLTSFLHGEDRPSVRGFGAMHG